MQALPTLLLLFTSRWGRSLIGASIMSALIWSFLPAVPFFARPLRRALAIAAVFAVFGLITWAVSWRARRRGRAVEAAVAGEGEGAAAGAVTGSRTGDAEATAEIAALRARLREAVATLRRRGVRRLYELPWYVVIGPPGAGKTTALRNSGLHFPLDTNEPDPLHGVGGTRLCDWWFSAEAVLIDTAGRYTTQDSNRGVDKAGWLGFLDLLRRTRPREPVNGAIVVIALTELLESTEEQRAAHARAIRLRIDELTERLRTRIPVYLVISKMDRLAGFDMFFDNLDSSGRAQVWGVTFGLEERADRFAPAFRALLDRIDDRLIDRMQAERGHDRRALLSGFPLQFASIEPVLASLLATGFSGSRLDPAPFLRGVYFTSATQSGTPFDRLTGLLARSFAIDQRQVPALRPSAARGYFLHRLTREVILGETPLVAISPGRFRRRKLLRAGALLAVAAITLLGLVAIWGADVEARVAITRQDDAFDRYRHAVEAFPNGAITDRDDLERVSALLDQAAGLPVVPPQGLAVLAGLSTRAPLAAAGRAAYDNALDHLLYPRLVWRIEQQMRSDMHDPSALYEATRVYLLLGGDGPHEPDTIRQWVEADWERRFPGVLNTTLRAHLARHLDALLAEPLPANQLPLDGALVAEARAGFGHVTPAERIYDRIRVAAREAGGGEAQGWSPIVALGPAAADTFERGTGAPLADGIAGFLTGPAFAGIMRRDLPPAARAVADESWVVGRDPDIATDGSEVARLEGEVARLWAVDATARWSALLADLDLLPLGDRARAENGLYLLSSPQSPLRDMLGSIARALRIGALPPTDPSAPVAAAWNAQWAPIFILVGQNAGAGGGGTASPPPSGPAPIDGILRLIAALDNELATGNATPAALPAVAQASADPASLLRAEATRQPHPLSQWLAQIANAGTTALGAEARSAASGAYNAASGPDQACRALVTDHYPFDRDSADDASLADFTRVFAPGGELDAYFEANVAPYVDRSGPTWRLHPAGGVAPPLTDAALAPFRRAAAIRQAFFPAGATPALYLTLNLAAPAATTLKLGNDTLASGVPATLTWPGSDSLQPAVLATTTKGKTTTIAREQGPWAVFRLLAAGTPSPVDDDPDDADDDPGARTRRYTFGTGTNAATLSIDAGGGGGATPARIAPGAAPPPPPPDPLDPGLLAGFTCPHVP